LIIGVNNAEVGRFTSTGLGIKTTPTGILTIGNPTGAATPGNIVLNFRDSTYPTYGWDWMVESNATGDMELHSVVNNVSTMALHFQRATQYLGVGTVPTSLLHVAGPIAAGTPKTCAGDYSAGHTAYAMLATDNTLIFTFVQTGLYMTMQAASSYYGRYLYLVNQSGGRLYSDANNILLPEGGAAQSIIINTPVDGYHWAILQSTGANWQIVARGI
jgi:hypothetical protein